MLRAYVKQYGPREWNLVSQRMNIILNRDVNSCSERRKNYLKPGIKKGSLTEEEQRLVIRLQAKHGNKWKKIAAQVLAKLIRDLESGGNCSKKSSIENRRKTTRQ